MEIRLSKDSSKFLKKIGTDKIAKQLALKIKDLQMNGHVNDSEALRGSLIDYYRVDIREYRIIYKIENEILFVALIGKRNDGEIYKMMERKK